MTKSATRCSTLNHPPTDSSLIGPTVSTSDQLPPLLFEISTVNTSSPGLVPVPAPVLSYHRAYEMMASGVLAIINVGDVRIVCPPSTSVFPGAFPVRNAEPEKSASAIGSPRSPKPSGIPRSHSPEAVPDTGPETVHPRSVSKSSMNIVEKSFTIGWKGLDAPASGSVTSPAVSPSTDR